MTRAEAHPMQIFATQKAAQGREPPPSLRQRRADLDTLRQALVAHRADIVAAVGADLGKHPQEVDLAEILALLSELAHARRHLGRWMRPRRAWPNLFTLGTTTQIRPEPRGVVLVIGPWNYPVLLSMAPVVSALAAGNRVVLKPSEVTPATSALLARIVARAFPPERFAVVEGGPETAKALTGLPFDHIFFTGSAAVGRQVMAAAAAHPTSVTLELGGKSPVVVDHSADLAKAARWIAWGKGLNAGQTCVAPDHVWVARPALAPLSAAILAEWRAMFPADRGLAGLTHIVDARHYSRLSGLLADALGRGAKAQAHGADDAATLLMAPRLLEGVAPGMRIAEEEIFGPLLPLLPFDDLAEPIAAIRAGPKPLTMYLFARDRGVERRLAAETQAGSMGVNMAVLPFIHPNIPFGGVGASGFGAAHGRAGFDTFSHLKPVMANRFSLLWLVFPPYGGRVARMIGVLRRLLR